MGDNTVHSSVLECGNKTLPCTVSELPEEVLLQTNTVTGLFLELSFSKSGGVHDSYTFQCGLVGYFTSPGIVP